MNERNIVRRIGIALAALCFVYLFSIGPVIAFALRKDPGFYNPSPMLAEAYSPLIWLCMASDPANAVVKAYVDFWRKLLGTSGETD
jgi:hypothetical protein